MFPESGQSPEEDIKLAIQQSQNADVREPADSCPPSSEVMVKIGTCPILGLRYAMTKCALMAERNPWQTVAALLVVTGCAWICAYFGMTVLIALAVYSVYAED